MQSGGLKNVLSRWELCFPVSSTDDQTGLRRCGRCGEAKPLEQFAWRCKARRQRDNYCGPCRAGYKREHYAANRSRYIERARARKWAPIPERAAYIVDFFRG